MKNKEPQIYKVDKVNFNDFAADFLYRTLKKIETAVEVKINIALSGGNTPLPILLKLKHKQLNWKRYNFFMVDERCVSITNDLSNFGNINDLFFKDIPSKYFSMVLRGVSFTESVENYKANINKHLTKRSGSFAQFDLILLGMGEDGHTASLFPETEGLMEENEIVIINKVPQLNTERITLTYPIILNASEIIVMVKGKSKESIIQEIYSGTCKGYPIAKIAREHSNIKWLIA
jgi:6-phosphogluconolactonase